MASSNSASAAIPLVASRGGLATADRWLGIAVQASAAALVAAEALLLFVGVLARYVFHAPILWTDEVASLLFLWLAMLGAVVATRRGTHMRMTAFVGNASPAVRVRIEAFSTVAALVFLALVSVPAVHYAADELEISTPALGISAVWRAAALPTGIVLMLASTLLQLARAHSWRVSAAALAIAAVAMVVFVALEPAWRSIGNANLLVFFVLLVSVLVFVAVPIAFAFGLSTFAYLALSTQVPLTLVIGRMDEGMSHLILLAVPLFVLLGLLIELTGMARLMVAFLANLLGHMRGGLSYVLVGAMYLVSGISGSKAADMAAIAPVLFPEMRKRGSEPGELVALLSATGAQTETVPPSLVLITIGSVTGVSIAALFTGGLLPSVVLAVTLCVVVGWRNRGEDMSGVKRAARGDIVRSLIVALPALALPFVIRAAVVEGVATATEVATVGLAYVIVLSMILYRDTQWRRLGALLADTAALSGAILLIIGTATGMAWALTQSGFSRSLAEAMAAMPGGHLTFLAATILAFIILGSVLEGIPAIVLFAPLVFPIARQLGIHEVHYAIVVVLSMGIGLFAPPFGVGYYTACAISNIDPDAGMRAIVGYLLALAAGLLIVAAIPWISIGFL